jgi:hypothetical protein
LRIARPPSGSRKGKEKETPAEAFSLAYVSLPHSGREYQDVSVRAVVEMDIGGLSKLEDVDDFIRTLGFRSVGRLDPAPSFLC